ncbi:DNA polymerase III subunit delta [Persicobacter psychrovividus]|uniref:DNA polymerase III subunit delta n=1 Tax=Persicobacter psychrovividus TaxID=387638 RepID=A0ABM7VDC6_9BACT|nr:DNA polymerase III subunit delta [Persicobacter psychrovividus]
MPHKPEDVLKELRKNQYAPVYFLQGDEPYFIDQISDFIENNALQEHERSFNQVILYGKDITIKDLLSQARRFPMMAERQVVIVKEAQSLAGLNNKEAVEPLIHYLKQVVPTTILVFNFKGKNLDKRLALYKAMDAHGIIVEAKKMYDNQLPAWVKNYVRTLKCSINDESSFLLTEHIGNDLDRLTNEIDKIRTNFNGPFEITPDLIEQYVGISKEYNVFEFQKALASRNVLKANKIAQYFAANPKDHPLIPIIAILFGFFSKLLIASRQKDQSEAGLARVLKLPPFVVREYKQALHQYPIRQLMSCIHTLHQADLQSKGVDAGQKDERAILTELVYNILH